MRFDRKLKTGLDYRCRDRVMAAAGAQRRDLALVIAVGEAEIVLRKAGMMEFRLGDIGHAILARLAGAPAKVTRVFITRSPVKLIQRLAILNDRLWQFKVGGLPFCTSLG